MQQFPWYSFAMAERVLQEWDTDPVAAVLHAVRSPHSRPYSHYPDVAITEAQAARIAEAVLATFDDVVSVAQSYWSEQWDADEHMRAYVRRRMRHALFETVAEQGLVPAGLPAEIITRQNVGPFGPDPLGAGKDVVVRLQIPVRRPRIDRARAVEAGLLDGPDVLAG